MRGSPEQSALIDEIKVSPTSYDYLYETGQEYEHDPTLPTVICITGTSGSGKDSIMDAVVKEGLCNHVPTHTTRKRRFKVHSVLKDFAYQRIASCNSVEEYLDLVDWWENEGLIQDVEPRDKYTWMRWRREDESESDYYNSLCTEYRLIEHNFHYGHLYGLSKESLDNADPDSIPLVRTDINGVRTIQHILEGQYNVFAIAFVPDDWRIIERAIREREGVFASVDDIAQRLIEDQENLHEFGIVDRIIWNKWSEVDGMPELEHSVTLARMVIEQAVGNS